MSIQVVCPNGHVLKVKSKYGGKVGLCPFCSIPVEIPQRRKVRESSLSGLSINVPEFAEERQLVKDADEVEKMCAKCHKNVPQNAAVCPHCHTYIAQLPD